MEEYPSERRLPALQPSTSIPLNSLQPDPFDDLFKDRQKLTERDAMTVIIGAKCRDGILILGDAQFTATDYHVTYDSKLFAFPNQDGANYVVGLAGFRHAFNYVKHAITSQFVDSANNTSLELDRFDCEEKLKALSDQLYNYYHVQREQRSGRNRFRDAVIGGVFAARVFENGNPELLLYNFSPYAEPDDFEFQTTGSGEHDAKTVYNVVKFMLRRVELDWNILPIKLVGQIMMFAMRYVSSLNISVGHSYSLITLTKEEGCKGRQLDYFYPRHFADDVPYKNELLATALEVLPNDKAIKLLEKLKFT